jgi:signal transduction histidine kinase
MPKLFNKFATTSNMEGISHGTGLGLYLSAKIIEGHKGRIGAENNKNGRGATFWLALPLL